jgi:hypothetical protein
VLAFLWKASLLNSLAASIVGTTTTSGTSIKASVHVISTSVKVVVT